MRKVSKNTIKFNQIVSLIAGFGQDDLSVLVKEIHKRKLMTVTEIAQLLGCSREEVYNIMEYQEKEDRGDR